MTIILLLLLFIEGLAIGVHGLGRMETGAETRNGIMLIYGILVYLLGTFISTSSVIIYLTF